MAHSILFHLNISSVDKLRLVAYACDLMFKWLLRNNISSFNATQMRCIEHSISDVKLVAIFYSLFEEME